MYVPNIPQIVLSILSRSGADRWADAPLLLLLVTAAPLLPDWDWCWAHNEDLHRATQQWNRDLHDCLHPDPPPKYLDIVHTPTFGWGSLATTGNEIAWTKEKPKHAKPLPCDFDEVLHHILCIYKVEVLLVSSDDEEKWMLLHWSAKKCRRLSVWEGRGVSTISSFKTINVWSDRTQHQQLRIWLTPPLL